MCIQGSFVSVKNDYGLLIVFFFHYGNIIFHRRGHNNRLRSRWGFPTAVRIFRSSSLGNILVLQLPSSSSSSSIEYKRTRTPGTPEGHIYITEEPSSSAEGHTNNNNNITNRLPLAKHFFEYYYNNTQVVVYIYV